jgi:hypothetical protein
MRALHRERFTKGSTRCAAGFRLSCFSLYLAWPAHRDALPDQELKGAIHYVLADRRQALGKPRVTTEIHLLFFRRPVLGDEQQNDAADRYTRGGYEPRIHAFAFQESKG